MTEPLPALAIPLQGKALIEASAGTGKTWTLTGILLRLLLEDSPAGERRPREIIAATFTRKAAAEMRRRVQARFDSFLRLARQLPEVLAAQADLFNDDAGLAERIGNLLDGWAQSGQADLSAAAADAVNRHLLLGAAAQGLDALIALLQRCDARSQDLDELYIGTLDGLCQRWLREFALETGSDSEPDLLEDAQEQEKIADLVHSHLRRRYQAMSDAEFAQWQAGNPGQREYDALVAAIGGNQQFAQLALEPLPEVEQDIAAIAAEREAMRRSPLHRRALEALRAFSAADIAAFARHWQDEIIAEGYVLKKDLPVLSYDIAALYAQLSADQGLDDEAAAFAELISRPDLPFAKKTPKIARQRIEAALALPLAEALKAAAAPWIHARHTLAELRRYQDPALKTRFGALAYVRAAFPDYLERSRQITFSEKLARLNRALAGGQGDALARYISYRYPVILVDESQDLNAAQADLLEHLHLRHFPPQGFLLLVGDPKQAIYRFRGGDVKNYLRLRRHFPPQQRYALSKSFRSSEALIDGLNAIYEQNDASAELAQGIRYEHMHSAKPAARIVQRDGTAPSAAVHCYPVESSEQEQESIVALVELLTGAHSPYLRLEADGSLHPIRSRDILILLRNNDKLAALQKALQARHIATEFDRSPSVFSGEIAREIGILLQAMQQPRHLPLLNRLLSGILFDYKQSDLLRLQALAGGESRAQAGELTLDSLSAHLQRAHELWQAQQPLAALHYLLGERLCHGRTMWEHVADFPPPARERYLLDLRSIRQIIADRGSSMPPAQFLHWWQQALADPPLNEWAQSSPLPGEDALRLMTIHSAKGLEAPVVIVGGLGRPRSDNTDIYTFSDADGSRPRLSVLPPDEARSKALARERDEELARLLYVALTRAADLLFVGMRKNVKGDYPFAPLNRLNLLELESPHSRLLQDPIAELRHSAAALPAPAPLQKQAADSGSYPRRHFSGWQKSSFSALARAFDARTDSYAADIADFVYEDDSAAQAQDRAELPFQLDFPRGPRPGSFLHEILEGLDAQHFSNYRQLIERFTRLYALPEEWIDSGGLRAWFDTISRSPLISGTRLADIAPAQRANEMGFMLGLDARREMPFARINALFARWGKAVQLPPRRSLIGFLRGEIDLCYTHEGRYYVLDYKSNHLGNRPQDYETASLQATMDEHHYWLQALIYQSALHRWLQNRLPDYRPEQHLSDVEYFFLRGCGLGAEGNGHLRVAIPLDILLEFDALLQKDPPP